MYGPKRSKAQDVRDRARICGELLQAAVHTRFKKGQSGNPRGRPVKKLADLLAVALIEKVAVTEIGKRRKVTKREAVIAQLVNKSASAELRAAKMLREIDWKSEDRSEDGSGAGREKPC